MNLATIEKVLEVKHHPNADKLDIVQVLGYEAIVGRDAYKAGDLVVFVQPDSILPYDQAWSQDLLRYTSRGRLRAVRLRGEWSMGLVISLVTFDPYGVFYGNTEQFTEGEDVTELLGVTKYEPALPKNLQAKGGLPYNIPRTVEPRWQNLRNLKSLFDNEVDVTIKIDGQSGTYYCVLPQHNPGGNPEPVVGLCSRSLELKNGIEHNSNWHTAERRYNILENLKKYCIDRGVSLAVRGEVFGGGIQAFKHNPHAGGDIDFAVFSVYNIGEGKYEMRDSDYYFPHVARALCIPHVPFHLTKAILTRKVIDAYDHKLEVLHVDGKTPQKFEGVVVQHSTGSFKIINKWYDQEKD